MAKIRNAKMQNLTRELESTQERLYKAVDPIEKNVLHEHLDECKNKLRRYIEYKAAGSRMRSKTQWYKEGKKGTKYFLGLEKVKYSNKTLSMIVCEDNTITQEEAKILKEQAKFYRKLYNKNPSITFNIQNVFNVSHPDSSKAEIDAEYTFADFTKALTQMARGKAPGNDGLTVAFYMVMWSKVGRIVWDAVQQSKINGMLYRSAHRGVISLIPKKNRDPKFIKSYRPLMLLNTDHKIITKMLTNRLKPYLTEVISPHQSGYVPGRFIGKNLRRLVDFIQLLERDNQEMILMSVNFEKCFNIIDHEALIKSLQFFNIGENFIMWVLMIYKGFEFCVINNGRWSTYHKQLRGVHQGSALSGPLFLYVSEIMSLLITHDDKIQGIEIGSHSEKLSQYADDTNIWSKPNERSLNAIIKVLEEFYLNTGLKVNYDKTILYRIGARSNKRLYLDRKFKWGKKTMDTLGLLISINPNETDTDLSSNYDNIVNKAENIMNSWSNRNLSLHGKVQVVNSLVNSLFVYKMQVLPTMSKVIQNKMNMLISKFIWNARKPKIRMKTMHGTPKHAGCKLSNLVLRDMALKIEWVRRLCEDRDPAWSEAVYKLINVKMTSEFFWECNLNVLDVKRLGCASQFWEDVMTAWCEYNFKNPTSDNQKANQIIWYNSFIKIKNDLVFYKNWYSQGIIYQGPYKK